MNRPAWAAENPLLSDYYDTEWGFPVRDTAAVYERIVLEGFQTGLSWATVLRRRPALRAAYSDFRPEAVAQYGEQDVARVLADPGVIRNERKVRAAVTNARATVALAADGGDLGELVWSFRPPDPAALSEFSPSRSAESAALSKELKRRGFVFVGPVTLYAAMEAMGVIEHRQPPGT